MKTQAIKLSTKIISKAKLIGGVLHRSAPKQLEHWVQAGILAEENPDLPYSLIQEIKLGQLEAENGDVSEYEFG